MPLVVPGPMTRSTHAAGICVSGLLPPYVHFLLGRKSPHVLATRHWHTHHIISVVGPNYRLSVSEQTASRSLLCTEQYSMQLISVVENVR